MELNYKSSVHSDCLRPIVKEVNILNFAKAKSDSL